MGKIQCKLHPPGIPENVCSTSSFSSSFFFLTMPSLRLKVYYRETGTFNSVLLTMLLSGTKSGSPSTKAVHSSLELALQDISSQEPVIRRYSF